MKVFITGGTGFVGSITAKALMDAGHQVRLLVRSEEKAKTVFDRLGLSIDDWVVGDVTDQALVEQTVQGCDAVIHAAAMVATSDKYADMVRKTNVGGTKAVIDASLKAGIDKIIYVSSVSALFDANQRVMNEDSPVSTSSSNNPYGQSKIACENYIRDLQAQGKPIVATYPAGVVGANDPGLSEPHFGLKLFVGQFTFTSTTGMQFVNVKDVARAHVAILETMQGPDRYMLGGCYYSWQELLRTARKVTGRAMPYVYIPGPVLRFFGKCADIFTKITGIESPLTEEGMGYATQWVYADSSKMEKELGITFTDKEETLAEVVQWLYQTGELSARKAGLQAKNA